MQPDILLPSPWLFRSKWPQIEEEMFQQIVNTLANKKIAILGDESQDDQHRFFFQIMFLELDIFTECKPFLVDTVFIDAANFETVSQAILICLNKFKIEFTNVYAYAADNVSYMKKAYTDVLCHVLSNCRRVTCNAHIESLPGDCFRDNMPEVNSLISLVKSIFCKALHRRRRYINFLKSRGVVHPKLPPNPIVVRWNTWFNASIYLEKNLDHMAAFVDEELATEEPTQCLLKLQALFKSKTLRDDLEFVVENCKDIVHLNIQFQHNKLNLTKVL